MKEADILSIKMGFVSSVKKRCMDFDPISLKDLLTRIEWSFEDSAQKIEVIRRLSCGTDEDMAKAKALKLKLPAVLPHAVLKKGAVRAKNKSFDLSGFVHMDIDSDAKSASSSAIKQALQAMNFPPIVSFTSPSGSGCKAIWLVEGLASASKGLSAPEKTDMFGKAWDFVAALTNLALAPLGLEVDQAPKSPLSTFFLSFDKCTVNLKCKKIDWASISTATVTPVKTSKISKSSTKKTASPKSVKSVAPSQPSSLPSFNTVQPMLQFLSVSKQKRAWAAIEKYFGLSSGLGLRYFGFFEMACTLCVLGKSKNVQSWSVHDFEGLLRLLDYDMSRSEKDQIRSTISSLQAYGHFSQASQTTSPPTKNSEIFAHLNRLTEADSHLTTTSFLAELHPAILAKIQAHRVLLLQAPTGSGKSTYFLSVLPQHTSGHVFFVVPLVSLRKQLWAKWKHLAGIEMLDEGDSVSADKKIHICTLEKMIYLRSTLQKGDIIVIDEAHILGESFRKSTSKILLSWIDDQALSEVRWVLTSATLQAFSSVAKKVLASPPHVLQVAGPRPPKNLQICISDHAVQTALHRVEAILDTEPTARILVFKNSKAILSDLQKSLDHVAIKSIIFSRDTREDEEIADLLEDGSMPLAPVILATSSASVGIEMLFLTHIIVVGPVQANLLVQVLDRNRKDTTPCELIVEKGTQETDFTSFLTKSHIKSLLQDVQKYHEIELFRLKACHGSFDVFEGGVDSFMSGAVEYWLQFKKPSIQDTLMKTLSTKSVIARHHDRYTLSICRQGILKNLLALEDENELDLSYLRLKLSALWGIGTKLVFDTIGFRPKKEKNAELWALLRHALPVPPARGDMAIQVRSALTPLQVDPARIERLIRQISFRFDWLVQEGQFLDEKHYIFSDDEDWQKLRRHVAMLAGGKMHFPVQWACVEDLKKNSLFGKQLSSQDCVEALKRCILKPEEEHLRTRMLVFSAKEVSSFFRSFLVGKEHRIKIAGKRTRVFEALSPAWEAFVRKQSVCHCVF